MRTFFVGALAVTLVGCSCYVSPQAGIEACTGDVGGFACFDRTAFRQAIEPEPAALDAGLSAPKTRSKIAARTEKPPSAHARHKADLATTTTKSATPTTNVEPAAAKVEPAAPKVEPPASGRPAETSDPVTAKAKITVAAKLEEPASAEFGEMKRAMRANTLGQSVDTICGRVKGRKRTGEGTGDMPFLYLVKDNEAFVVDGPPTSAAASAYRNICN
jgi:hypothetical protein